MGRLNWSQGIRTSASSSTRLKAPSWALFQRIVELGVSGSNLAPANLELKHIHTAADTLERIRPEILAESVDVAEAIIRELDALESGGLGSADLR